MDNSLSLDSINKSSGLKYYSTKIDTDADSTDYLSFDDYLSVMAAEMSNQDFNNPMDTTQYLNQMSSYSMMEAISTLNKQSQMTYAASMLGKAVTVSDNGVSDTGVVESIIMEDDKYYLLVNGHKYQTSNVSDLVDNDVYNNMAKFLGETATLADGTTGKITNIVCKNGQGMVMINEQLYSVDEVVSLGEDKDKEVVNSAEKVAEAIELSEEKTEDDMMSAQVSQSNAAMNMPDDGREVDMYYYGYDYNDGETGLYIAPETNTSPERVFTDYDEYKAYLAAQFDTTNSINNQIQMAASSSDILDSIMSEYSDSTAEVLASSSITPIAESRGAASVIDSISEDDLTGSVTVDKVVANGSIYNNDEEDEEIISFASVEELSANSSDIATDEQTLSILSQPTSTISNTVVSEKDYLNSQLTKYPSDSSSFVYGSNSYWDNKYVDVNDRAFADRYAAEAQKALSTGTKMLDIRYINNHAITSEINTDKILGFTDAGKAFTDIGYSGVGDLGEVITWADGTQRVEVITDHGSAWYTTTGRFTLDEICDWTDNLKPEVALNLTPFEKIIRDRSRVLTASERAEINRMDTYISRL